MEISQSEEKMKTTENTEYTEDKYPSSKITDDIIKCAIEVHKTLGPGFIEGIYENALIRELQVQGLQVENQKSVPIKYKGVCIGEHRLDLLVEGKIIVENKAVKELDEIHIAQVLSYLKATKQKVALLLNFAKPKIQIRRIIL